MVKGEIASKSNSRKLVTQNGKPRFIKSQKARDYQERWEVFAKRREPLFDADVILAVRVYYQSRRPDLDITHLKDLLQGYAYENDRQVKMEFAVWALDRDNPRCQNVVAPRRDWREVVAFLMQFDGYPYEPPTKKRRRKRR